MLALYESGNEAAWLASFSFGVDVRPRYCECDGQGHVSNVVYPAYLELSRLQYFKAANDPEAGAFAFQHVAVEFHMRYLAACYYDEPLRVVSRLVGIGRSSATMEQALAGQGCGIRAIARVVLVRMTDVGATPWSDAQRAALTTFEPRAATHNAER